MPSVDYDPDTKELITDFQSRIEGLKRDGVPDFPPLGGRLPWSEASEERKLENIVWESMALRIREDVIAVPDAVSMEVIERNIDYSKLPEEKRSALLSLRSDPDQDIAKELQRIAGMEYQDHEPDFHEPAGPSLPIDAETDCVVTELEKAWKEILATPEPARDVYDDFLNEATERALSRMEGRDTGRER